MWLRLVFFSNCSNWIFGLTKFIFKFQPCMSHGFYCNFAVFVIWLGINFTDFSRFVFCFIAFSFFELQNFYKWGDCRPGGLILLAIPFNGRSLVSVYNVRNDDGYCTKIGRNWFFVFYFLFFFWKKIVFDYRPFTNSVSAPFFLCCLYT